MHIRQSTLVCMNHACPKLRIKSQLKIYQKTHLKAIIGEFQNEMNRVDEADFNWHIGAFEK